MAASTPTNSFRSAILDLLRDGLITDRYYAAIGRSIDLDSSNPADMSSLRYQMTTRNSLQSYKRITNASFVIPRVNWVSGTIYSAYDDNLPDQTNFYVLNSENNIFLCIEPNKNASGTIQVSTTAPTSILANYKTQIFTTSDGYKWKWIATVSNFAKDKFLNNDWIPVKFITGSPSIFAEVTQKGLQDSASASRGKILGIAIDDGGTGFINPTLTVTGNGSSASFTPTISGGKIVKIVASNHGSNYDFAGITINSDGTSSPFLKGASLRPVFIHSDSGDPVQILKSKTIAMQVSFENDETDTISVDNDFRQIALIKNPKVWGTSADSAFTGNTGNALRALEVNSISSFTEDDIISVAGGASARVHSLLPLSINSPPKILYYQSDSTGFAGFSAGQTISGALGGSTTIKTNGVDHLRGDSSAPDVDPYTGDILYINNIGNGIDRQSGQTEDVKILIQL
jgi:hypothetical protein